MIQIDDEFDAKNRAALVHVQSAMFSLPLQHVSRDYLLIAEAFLQREIFGRELERIHQPAKEQAEHESQSL